MSSSVNHKEQVKRNGGLVRDLVVVMWIVRAVCDAHEVTVAIGQDLC